MCGANGKKMNVGKHNWDIDNFNYAYLRHFFTKTAEEFYMKLNKTFADIRPRWYKHRYIDRFKVFFTFNEITPAKLAILKNLIIDKIGKKYYLFYHKQIYSLASSLNYLYEGKNEKICNNFMRDDVYMNAKV